MRTKSFNYVRNKKIKERFIELYAQGYRTAWILAKMENEFYLSASAAKKLKQ